MDHTSALFAALFDYSQFMPHGYCLLWQPVLIWMYVISDLVITLAYYSIPVTIFYMVHKRRKKLPYRWVFIMFAVFILLCGTTHLLEIVILWYPLYYVQALLKVLTAAASLAAALLILPLVPAFLNQFGEPEGMDRP